MYRITLRSLERRYLELHDEIADLDVRIAALVDELAPGLIAHNSIGYESVFQLFMTVGDNSIRLQPEASIVALSGVSPVSAPLGKVACDRLNLGGDRAASCALHIIAIGRWKTDPRNEDYVSKRVSKGRSKHEDVRDDSKKG